MEVAPLARTGLSYPVPKTASEPLYTMKDVQEHTDGSSCWVVYRDRVYDVTSFLEQHPGGSDIMIENAGRDITVTFEDKGHSRFAYEVLEQYRIGYLVEHERIGSAK